MQFKLVPILKLLFVVIIGLFVLKLGSKILAEKWPNTVTTSLDSVIQSA